MKASHYLADFVDTQSDTILGLKQSETYWKKNFEEQKFRAEEHGKKITELNDLVRALKDENRQLDKMLQEELRLKKQTALVVDIDQLDLFI
jgi:hypothetical protein